MRDGDREQYRHQMFFLWRERQWPTQRNCGVGHKNGKGMMDRLASNFSGATFVFSLWHQPGFLEFHCPQLAIPFPLVPTCISCLPRHEKGEGSILGNPPSLCASCPCCRAPGTAGPSGSAGQRFNSMCSMLSGLINLILPLIE